MWAKEEYNELSDSSRDENGFGSSGVEKLGGKSCNQKHVQNAKTIQ